MKQINTHFPLKNDNIVNQIHNKVGFLAGHGGYASNLSIQEVKAGGPGV